MYPAEEKLQELNAALAKANAAHDAATIIMDKEIAAAPDNSPAVFAAQAVYGAYLKKEGKDYDDEKIAANDTLFAARMTIPSYKAACDVYLSTDAAAVSAKEAYDKAFTAAFGNSLPD